MHIKRKKSTKYFILPFIFLWTFKTYKANDSTIKSFRLVHVYGL